MKNINQIFISTIFFLFSCKPNNTTDFENMKGEWFLRETTYLANDSTVKPSSSCQRYFFYEIDADNFTGTLMFPLNNSTTSGCSPVTSKIKYIDEVQPKLRIDHSSNIYYLKLKTDSLLLENKTLKRKLKLTR